MVNKKMRIGFIITARMKSTRLPKKAVLKINNKEIITILIERLKKCKKIDEIIIATSTNSQDDILCKIAKREKVKCFRGSEDDVLQRLYNASKEFSLEYILNITADCPLASYDICEDIIDHYKKTDADLITTYKLPHGFFIYGIKPEALEKINEIKDDKKTEVWLRYFTDTGMFKVSDLEIPKELIRKEYRLSIDYIDDYKFFQKLFEKMGPDTHFKSTKEIINFLDKNPDIVSINSHCEEKYKKRWEKQNRMKIK